MISTPLRELFDALVLDDEDPFFAFEVTPA
jgi:hypothetical protein